MALKLIAYERRRKQVDDEYRPLLLRGRGNRVRAILSDAYVPLDDGMVLSALREALDAAGVDTEVYAFDRGPANTYLRLLFKGHRVTLRETRRKGDVVGVGLFLRNSEVGAGSLTIESFLLRLVCTNGMVAPHDGQGYRWRHVAVDPRQVAAGIQQAVARVADEGAEFIARFDQSARISVRGGAEAALTELAKQEEFSQDLTARLLESYRREAHDSLFGVVNAITHAARRQPADLRTHLETLAGGLVRWPERYGVGVG